MSGYERMRARQQGHCPLRSIARLVAAAYRRLASRLARSR
jgi:hypothetical protein